MRACEPDRDSLLDATTREHRQLILRRLPVFGVGWFAMALVWSLVLGITLPSTWPFAGLLFVSQGVVLVAVALFCRHAPRAARIPLVLLTCIVLGFVFTAIFAAAHSYADVLAFILLALYVAAALLFALGWAAELGLIAPTLTVYALAIPFLRPAVPPVALAAAIAIGVVMSLAIAEASLRAFQLRFRERESAARYRGIVESSLALICRIDREGRFTFLNDTYCRLLGRPLDEMIGQHASVVVHEADLEAVREMERTIALPSYRMKVECRNRTPNGWVWIAWEGGAVSEQHGAAVEGQAFGHDVTERRVAEEALRAAVADLRASEERLRLLARHQVEIREEERKRLSVDLHEGVCQELVGIAILAESLRQHLGPLPAVDASSLDRIARALREVVDHLRELAHGMRPLLLHDLGLEGCLRSLAAGMVSAETRVTAELESPTPRLDEESELGIYRIAQEALLNAVRHAAARHVVVALGARDGKLRLEVRDDGCGFDTQYRRRSSCLGLASMEERAIAIGARFELRSEPRRGTVVTLECPLASGAPVVSSP